MPNSKSTISPILQHAPRIRIIHPPAEKKGVSRKISLKTCKSTSAIPQDARTAVRQHIPSLSSSPHSIKRIKETHSYSSPPTLHLLIPRLNKMHIIELMLPLQRSAQMPPCAPSAASLSPGCTARTDLTVSLTYPPLSGAIASANASVSSNTKFLGTIAVVIGTRVYVVAEELLGEISIPAVHFDAVEAALLDY